MRFHSRPLLLFLDSIHCIFCVYRPISYHDLSVHSMSGMGLKK